MTRIDVHHHILPSDYVTAVGAETIASQGSSGRLPSWSVEGALELMDAASIGAAVTSITAPGVHLAAADEAARVARECNEYAAAMVKSHPARFGMFATLPLQTVDGALTEADYSLETLSADGVCLLSNYSGKYLGDAEFRPLYEELERRKAVVFVHPTSPAHRVDVDGMSPSMLEFPFDTTRSIASLLVGGVVSEFPSIRWIFSHAGGTLPYLAGRLEVLIRNNSRLQEGLGGDLTTLIQSLYFDLALSADPMHIGALRALVPDSQILFGSDYPFGPAGQMEDTVNRLDNLDFSAETRLAINAGNAVGLFPRLAESMRSAAAF